MNISHPFQGLLSLWLRWYTPVLFISCLRKGRTCWASWRKHSAALLSCGGLAMGGMPWSVEKSWTLKQARLWTLFFWRCELCKGIAFLRPDAQKVRVWGKFVPHMYLGWLRKVCRNRGENLPMSDNKESVCKSLLFWCPLNLQVLAKLSFSLQCAIILAYL